MKNTENEITVREAVLLSGFSRQWIYDLLAAKHVASRKFGSVYFVDRASLLAYLRSPRRRAKKA